MELKNHHSGHITGVEGGIKAQHRMILASNAEESHCCAYSRTELSTTTSRGARRNSSIFRFQVAIKSRAEAKMYNSGLMKVLVISVVVCFAECAAGELNAVQKNNF